MRLARLFLPKFKKSIPFLAKKQLLLKEGSTFEQQLRPVDTYLPVASPAGRFCAYEAPVRPRKCEIVCHFKQKEHFFGKTWRM